MVVKLIILDTTETIHIILMQIIWSISVGLFNSSDNFKCAF